MWFIIDSVITSWYELNKYINDNNNIIKAKRIN
jgi:hypothetical protein